MNPSNQHTPDNRWREAFEEASETPPNRVWDAIERRLDEDDDRAVIIPFWRQYMPWASGIAAAVALVLVGWWLMRTDSPTGTDLARQSSAEKPEITAQQSAPATEANTNTTKNPESLASESAARPKEKLKRRSSSREVSPPDDWNHPHYARTYDPLAKERITNRRLAKSAPVGGSAALTENETMALTAIPNRNSLLVPAAALAIMPSQMPPDELPLSGYPVQDMKGHMIWSGMRETQRMVWFRAPEADIVPEVEVKKNNREMWASVSVMPSAFNPAVSVRPSTTMMAMAASPSFANQNTISTSTPSLQSRSDLSMAYQAGTGLQLSNHWSIETGIAYLAGRSTVSSPVRVSVASNPAMLNRSASNNFFVETIKSAAGNTASMDVQNDKGAIAYVANSSLYDASSLQSVSNDYRFVQVPVQVGYQLRPKKVLGISLLGGMLANWFVRNDVGENLSVKAGDGFYKPVTLSGVAGMRLRYRPGRRWSASMAGVYQRALQSGTQPTIELQTRPEAVGMSFGVNYHF